MGANMVRRLLNNRHVCVVYDRSLESVMAMKKAGATGASSLEDLVEKLAAPKIVLLMALAAGLVPSSAETRFNGKSLTRSNFWTTSLQSIRQNILNQSDLQPCKCSAQTQSCMW